MPTVLRLGAYRFFFYSGDRAEPPHVHVERDERCAKFWLEPVRLGTRGGFGGPELRELEGVVKEHAEHLLRAWDEFFGFRH